MSLHLHGETLGGIRSSVGESAPASLNAHGKGVLQPSKPQTSGLLQSTIGCAEQWCVHLRIFSVTNNVFFPKYVTRTYN